MKTTTTIKQTLLALALTLSIVSCKKDKKDEPTPPPVEVKAITFTELKALSTGASVKVPDAKKITGIVISDVSSKNIDSKTVVLQDAASQVGIIVTFDAAQTFAAGDQVEVDISGQTLAQVNGEIELTNIPAAKAKKTGTGTITAKATTAADIATNKAAWDGTLVTIAATDLTGTTAKYSGTLTIKDASGTVTSAVLAGASFETTDLPASVSSVTGIVRISGTDVRVDIRKTADVITGAVTRVVTEMFENATGMGTDPSSFEAGFTTSIGEWSSSLAGGNGLSAFYYGYHPGSFYGDGDFTTPGRSYIYSLLSVQSNGDGGLPCSFTNLKGLKTISVTFAGSKVTTAEFFGTQYQVTPINPATDYIQIGIAPGIQGVDAALSPKYTKNGEFYTFTYTLPTKEKMQAKGIADAIIDRWLDNPVFTIQQLSSLRTGNGGFIAPILFDKVVFGYGN